MTFRGSCVMARKRKRVQKGRGFGPYVVDVKKGIQVTKDLVGALKKTVNKQKAKATVAGYRQQYRRYKQNGGKKSYNQWIVDKGYGKRNSGCTIM